MLGDKLGDAFRRIGKWTVEIVKRSDVAKGSWFFRAVGSSSEHWPG
jgi:hypothetical protein